MVMTQQVSTRIKSQVELIVAILTIQTSLKLKYIWRHNVLSKQKVMIISRKSIVKPHKRRIDRCRQTFLILSVYAA